MYQVIPLLRLTVWWWRALWWYDFSSCSRRVCMNRANIRVVTADPWNVMKRNKACIDGFPTAHVRVWCYFVRCTDYQGMSAENWLPRRNAPLASLKATRHDLHVFDWSLTQPELSWSKKILFRRAATVPRQWNEGAHPDQCRRFTLVDFQTAKPSRVWRSVFKCSPHRRNARNLVMCAGGTCIALQCLHFPHLMSTATAISA